MMTPLEKAAARYRAERDEIAIKLILEDGMHPSTAKREAERRMKGLPLASVQTTQEPE